MSYGPPPQSAPPKSAWLGVIALILGVLGVVATFLPIDLTGVRAYVAWLFGLPGIVVAALGLLGHRRGKPMAAIGAMLSLLALVVGAIALGNLVGLL